MRGADIPPWDMPTGRALLLPLFLQAVWVKSSPSVVFHVIWSVVFFFSLNAIFVGNAGDGKDAPWELMGVNWGEKNVEKASYPGWDHIRL